MQDQFDIDPALNERIRSVARRCARQRQMRYTLRAGIYTLALVLLGTLLLRLAAPGWHDPLLLLLVAAIGLGMWRWIRPLYAHPISDEQVAMFIDENLPELQNRMLTMVEVGKHGRGHDNSWLIRRFFIEAQHHLRSSALFEDAEWSKTKRLPPWPLVLMVLSLVWVIFFADVWQPQWRTPWTTTQRGYTVSPGDARVQIGEDVNVFVASSLGPRAFIIQYRTNRDSWTEAPMSLGDSEGVYFHTFKQVQQVLSYRIRLDDETSPTYRLTPFLAPEITRLDLTYTYPNYLRSPPREVPSGGDITALEGTQVELSASVNKPLSSLAIVLGDGSRIAMHKTDDLLWQGKLLLSKNDEYFLEPKDSDGAGSLYASTYKITALPDQAPSLRVNFPFRDLEVSPLDEVGFEFQISDDFGLASYGIRYQVADRKAVDVVLSKGMASGSTSVDGHHRLMLEELNLAPGDLLTWSIWARDLKPDRGPLEGMGDPYFLEIRPFKRLFREAVSDSGQDMGKGEDLIGKQKQVLIATWNLRKDSPNLAAEDYAGKLKVIRETQAALRELAEKSMSMTIGDRPEFASLMEAMADAVSALDAAKKKEQAIDTLARAADAEQRSYRILLQLVPRDTDVGRKPSDDSEPSDRQMAGMNELELDRNKNFYEEERRTRAQQEETAQALDKIKDLAQRQKMINDEVAKLISEQERRDSDRREIQRRLERLREEAKKNIEQLDRVNRELGQSQADSARSSQKSLEEARDQMSRTLDKLNPETLQDARASSSEALRNLNNLEDNLEKRTQGSAQDRMAALKQDFEQLRQDQKQLQARIDELEKTKDSPRLTAEDPEQVKKTALMRDKEALSQKFQEVMEDASSLSNMTRGDQEHLARKLGDWLRKTSKEGIGEEMETTTELARMGAWQELAEKEKEVARKLEQAAKGLDQVASQMGGSELAKRQQALSELEAVRETLPKTGSPKEMTQFAQERYRDALESLRNADSLLGNSRYTEQIGSMRKEVEQLRRKFKRDGDTPKFEMVRDLVAHPLDQTIAALKREVTALAQNRQFVLSDDTGVPENYRKQVAEYFKILTEAEGN